MSNELVPISPPSLIFGKVEKKEWRDEYLEIDVRVFMRDV